jgi:5-methylcytosine-specific restriction endonuclease McrA
MANRKASETLGMPPGTASNRLRKMLLFRQLKKHNENTCVRCEKEIETVEELSVEHIKPWEGISANLFWDLDNVAFSHMRCNVPHTRRGGEPNRKIGPEGTAWCSSCEKFLSVDNFYETKHRWHGYFNKCKECYAKARKEYPSR